MAGKIGRPRSKHTPIFDEAWKNGHWRTIRAAHRRALLDLRRLKKRVGETAPEWHEESVRIDVVPARAIAAALNEGMTKTEIRDTLPSLDKTRYYGLMHRNDNWWELKPWVLELEQTFE